MVRTLPSPAAVSELIPPGATVAVGGAGLNRKPMALLKGIVGGGVRDLDIVSFLGSVDVEYLLASGAVADLQSAGVSLDGFGLAPAFRAARQQQSVRFVEWSEASMVAAVEAAARGLPSMPCSTAPGSDVVKYNPSLGVYKDPPTGIPTVFATALAVDIALIHAPAADVHGNIYVDGDLGLDGLLARAAQTTIVSFERRADRRSSARGDFPAMDRRGRTGGLAGPGQPNVTPTHSWTSGPSPRGPGRRAGRRKCWRRPREHARGSVHHGARSRVRRRCDR